MFGIAAGGKKEAGLVVGGIYHAASVKEQVFLFPCSYFIRNKLVIAGFFCQRKIKLLKNRRRVCLNPVAFSRIKLTYNNMMLRVCY